MKKKIIFCVDDEKIVLNSLKTELKDSFGDNYVIETAENAAEALDTINDLLEDNFEIPLIISDYAMPVIKGDEFLEKAHKISPNTLTILLTGQATVEGVTNSINKANLYRYISKPWEIKDLNLTINQALKSYDNQNKLEVQNAQLQEMSRLLEEKVEIRTKELSDANSLLIEKSNEIEIQNTELIEYRTHLEDLVKERTSQLESAKEKAEESDNLKSAFMANISHEIRTPMNGIIGFIELLRDSETEEIKRQQFMSIIENCSKQLLNIITDIIEISKLDTKQVQLKPTICSLNEIQNTISTFYEHNTFKKSNIQFKTSFSAGDLHFSVDEVKLQQILTNLLNNAIKFTFDGTIELGCTLIQNKEILFYVRDTGLGIEEKDYNVIFDRFRQIETELSKKSGGTGLGLAISKAYAELMGGQIWLESEIDKGSTFYIKIPYIPAKIEKPKVESYVNLNSSIPTNATVLVAEDDDTNFDLLEIVLSKLDLHIIRAKNGKEAVDTCIANPNIDLVLMDIKMPILNGLEATAEILSHRENLPIIAQTAGAFSDDKKNAIEVGCVDYITKPINFDELLEKVSNHLKVYSL